MTPPMFISLPLLHIKRGQRKSYQITSYNDFIAQFATKYKAEFVFAVNCYFGPCRSYF